MEIQIDEDGNTAWIDNIKLIACIAVFWGHFSDATVSFEDDRACSIRSYKVSGTTVKRKLYATDKKDRYIHIYYDDGRTVTFTEAAVSMPAHTS